jgi:hypothetical protein
MATQVKNLTDETPLTASLRKAGRCSGVYCGLSDNGGHRIDPGLRNILITVQQVTSLIGGITLDTRISPNVNVPGWKNAAVRCAAALAIDNHTSFKPEENKPVLRLTNGEH